MSKYILKYSRGEEVKYISHLDFVRFIHRVIRRAGLPMEFSQGFNPHPIMTVAMPLSVGITSESEYMKIGFNGEFSEDYIKDTLNKNMPRGFSVLAVKKDEEKKYDFKKLDRAEYIVTVETIGETDLKKFLENNELNVMKKSKSGVKEADIRPYIYEISEISRDENSIVLKMQLAAGNNYNLKPETVLDAMEKYSDNFKVEFWTIHRSKILAQDKELIK